MDGELPRKGTCWQWRKDPGCLHLRVTGSRLLRLVVHVTFRWRGDESLRGDSLIPLTTFLERLEPCTNPEHSSEVAHA